MGRVDPIFGVSISLQTGDIEEKLTRGNDYIEHNSGKAFINQSRALAKD
jgi:hypothetical protein